MIRALLFDLDDTLYDESSYVASGFRAVAAWLEQTRGWEAERVYKRFNETLAIYGRGQVFDRVMTEFGDCADRDHVDELVQRYRAHVPVLRLHADASACLKTVSGRYLLGLVTDGLPLMQRSKVAALGLESIFNTVIYSWDLNRPKPDPGGYAEAMRRLGVPAQEALIIGDRPDHDMAPARALGVAAVRVRRGRYAGMPLEPCASIIEMDDLARLPAWLESNE